MCTHRDTQRDTHKWIIKSCCSIKILILINQSKCRWELPRQLPVKHLVRPVLFTAFAGYAAFSRLLSLRLSSYSWHYQGNNREHEVVKKRLQTQRRGLGGAGQGFLVMVMATSLPAGFPMQMFVLRILTRVAQSPDPVWKVTLRKIREHACGCWRFVLITSE